MQEIQQVIILSVIVQFFFFSGNSGKMKRMD